VDSPKLTKPSGNSEIELFWKLPKIILALVSWHIYVVELLHGGLGRKSWFSGSEGLGNRYLSVFKRFLHEVL
jgi:hypothetical protein